MTARTPGTSTHGANHLLTIAQVCEELRVSRSTFYDWRAKGRRRMVSSCRTARSEYGATNWTAGLPHAKNKPEWLGAMERLPSVRRSLTCEPGHFVRFETGYHSGSIESSDAEAGQVGRHARALRSEGAAASLQTQSRVEGKHPLLETRRVE
jgi:hypothetical protein